MIVTVHSRPGCHLCDEAITGLEGLRAEFPQLEIKEVDIERDDGLLKRYLERIPVIEVDGEVVSELTFDREAVETRLGQIP
ncbi:MAG: glutaredoxin family protein [Actinomycetota bacterium]|nr:glutaredoxin family protein [Actinomycetota bacterium]